MGQTSINDIPYPDGTDAPDITAEFAAAAAAIDRWTVKRYANAAERDGINTSPQEGEIAYLVDGGGIQYTGTEWVSIGQRRTLLKTAIETTTSTTLQDDNHLSVTLGKNGQYDIDIFLLYSSTTDVIGYGLEMRVDAPQTVEMACDFVTVQAGAGMPILQDNHVNSFNTYSTNFTIGLGGNDDIKLIARFRLRYATGNANEVLKLQWCAHSGGDSGHTAKVHPGTHMVVKRISIAV